VLADHLAADGAFRQRFLREARLAARLCHPNIVTVFDAGDDGRPFLVMEFVDGETVAGRLARGPALGPEDVVRLARDLSAGLAQAHALGIVHRDVKPHNVILGPGGVAKLTDFGIARALEEGGLTEIGTVLGTAPFMAPEQAAGAAAAPAADVFALGALVRHAAGGALPAPLEPLVEAALNPEPSARPTAEEFHARLAALDDDALADDALTDDALTDDAGGVDDAAPTVVATPPAATQILRPPPAPEPTPRTWTSAAVGSALFRRPVVAIVAAAAVLILVFAVLAGGSHGRGSTVTPVPNGPDAAQTARNLATWLRDQAGN